MKTDLAKGKRIIQDVDKRKVTITAFPGLLLNLITFSLMTFKRQRNQI